MELRAMRPYYTDDAVTIYHGDCREVLPTLERVDHVITDPPYARDVYVRLTMPNSKKGSETPARIAGGFTLNNGDRVTALAAGAIGAIDDLIEPMGVEFARLARRWVLVFSDVESAHLWKESCESAGLRYVRTCAWVKPDPMPQMTGDRPAVGFEPFTLAHAKGVMRWNGGGKTGVYTFNIAKGDDRPDHPCPKPSPLMRALISDFTDPGDLILDPFGGSGTTARAAKDLGRRCILIEREERWAEVAAKRMAQSVLPLEAAR